MNFALNATNENGRVFILMQKSNLGKYDLEEAIFSSWRHNYKCIEIEY